MLVLKIHNYKVVLLLLGVYLLFASNSVACASLVVNDHNNEGQNANSPAIENSQETKSDERDGLSSNLEDKSDASEKERLALTNPKTEDSDGPHAGISKKEREESSLVEENREDANLEDTNHAPVDVDLKKQKSKEDKNRETDLNDVNFLTDDEGLMKGMKRDTRNMDFLSLPRDASYFFDDLEPFINNSDNRVGRAAVPPHIREIKNQKSKVSGKEKPIQPVIQDDVDAEDEVEGNEEEHEKENEDEYDEDEEVDAECPPETTLPECTTMTTCPTSHKTTTECTTPTTCKTTHKAATTKLPHTCAKETSKAKTHKTTTECIDSTTTECVHSTTTECTESTTTECIDTTTECTESTTNECIDRTTAECNIY